MVAKNVKKAKRPDLNKIPKELLEVLCCPSDKGELNYDPDKAILTCKKCKKNYEVKDGIPILLP